MNNKKPSSYLLTRLLLLLLLFAWKAAELSVLPVAHISPFFPSLCHGTYSVREKKNRHNLNNKLVCFKQLHSSKPLFNTLDGCYVLILSFSLVSVSLDNSSIYEFLHHKLLRFALHFSLIESSPTSLPLYKFECDNKVTSE